MMGSYPKTGTENGGEKYKGIIRRRRLLLLWIIGDLPFLALSIISYEITKDYNSQHSNFSFVVKPRPKSQ